MTDNIRNASAIAEEVLKELEIERPPVDPLEIAKDEGLIVVFATFERNLSTVSGFYDPEDRKIYVNENEDPYQQRFTLAHELGHHFLHRQWAHSEDYKVLLRGEIDEITQYDVEANEFASNLLMPKFMLDRYRDLPIETLFKLFAVSIHAIENRIMKTHGNRSKKGEGGNYRRADH